MLKQLLLTTALAALVAAPVVAQDNTNQSGQSPTVQTPPPPAPTAQDQAAPALPSATTAAEQQVTPPPADAMMSTQGATDMRADKLIGTSVYNTEGQSVGSVQDIVFDKDGKIVGVVLKVGGILGIGGKSVGIKWTEVQVTPKADAVKVNYTEDQLKVAPDFKTQESISAEQPQQPLAPASPTSTQ
jgi:sporulation protein YlmC with PRC-barrel domain